MLFCYFFPTFSLFFVPTFRLFSLTSSLDLRLQLLEKENQYLFKALYGLLMILPQSSAFATLRNRLNSVSSMGVLNLMPPPSKAQIGGSEFGGIDTKALLAHFKECQGRHDAARRVAALLIARESRRKAVIE